MHSAPNARGPRPLAALRIGFARLNVRGLAMIAHQLLGTVKAIGLLALDSVVRAGITARADRRQVLVLRLDHVGDYILARDSLNSLRAVYPRKEFSLTLLGSSAWAGWASQLSGFDEVWELDRKRFVRSLPYRWKLLSRIRSRGFDCLLQPRYSRELLFEDAIARVSGATSRISLSGDPRRIGFARRRLARRWYSRIIEASPGACSEFQRNAEFLRGLGVVGSHPRLPEIEVTSLDPAGLSNTDYFVVSPGASWSGRQWPIANFVSLIERIHSRTGWSAVVCGGVGERALADEMLRRARVPLVDMVGRTSLDQLAGITAGARLIVGNETGAIHLAAAVGTPSICILGGGHYGRFLPYPAPLASGPAVPKTVTRKMDCYGCDWVCRFSRATGEPVPCIAGISVDQAWRAVSEVLDEMGASSMEVSS